MSESAGHPLERGADAMPAKPIARPYDSSDIRWACLIFVAALAIRVVYLAGWIGSPYYGVPLLDEQYHHDWALRIAQGQPPEAKPFFRAPLYPYILAGIYRLFSASPLPPRIEQMLIGGLSALLVFFLGRRLFGRGVGAAAGLLAAVYPVLVFFDGELLFPNLLAFLDLLFALALVAAWPKPRGAPWFAAGLAGGLSAIARPNILMPMAALAAWRAWGWRHGAEVPPANCSRRESRRQCALALCLFALGAALPIAPVTLHNRIVGKDWVLIASQGGIVAWAGNGPYADGFNPTSGRLYTRFERYEDTFELYAKHEAEEAAGRPLKASEVSRYWSRRTARHIAENPGRWLALMGKKIAGFWTREEVRNNKYIPFALSYSPPLAALHRVLNFGLIGPFALLGLVWALRAAPAAAPVAAMVWVYCASIMLFFVCDRYRAPMTPFFLLFGAWAAGRLIGLARRREWRALRVPLAGLAAAAVLVNVDWFGLSPQPIAEDYWMVATCHLQKGENDLAREAYGKALAADPAHYGALLGLSNFALWDGNPEEAERYCRRAIETSPAFPTAYNSLGALQARRGDAEGARANFQRCLELDPYHALAWANLAETYRRAGQLDEARQGFERAAELFPSHLGAYIGLARIAAERGDGEAARRWIARALSTGDSAALATVEADPALKAIWD